MIKLPVSFTVFCEASSGIANIWKSKADDFPPIDSAIPPEFGGPGKGYSPEDFFALSVLNCIVATFKVYCEKSNLSFQKLLGKAEIQMDKHPQENHLWISHLDISIKVEQASERVKIKETLDRAIKECAVSNSIKSGKTFHLEVV